MRLGVTVPTKVSPINLPFEEESKAVSSQKERLKRNELVDKALVSQRGNRSIVSSSGWLHVRCIVLSLIEGTQSGDYRLEKSFKFMPATGSKEFLMAWFYSCALSSPSRPISMYQAAARCLVSARGRGI